MPVGGWGYLGAFVASLVLAGLLTPLMLRFALRRGVLDVPGDHKSHSSPVPYLGGVAILLAFAGAVMVAGLLHRPVGGLDALAIVLGIGLLLSLVGLFDDLRGLGAGSRLLVEAGAGVAVWAVGSGAHITDQPLLNLLITVLWVVGITNAFNMLDNMDGLSAGTAVVASGAFFAIAVLNNQYLVAALAAAVAGCALGFLRHNFHPAKIYMGDAGSMFLGFMLAVLGLRLRLVNTPPLIAALVPVVVLGVPVFDATLVIVNRIRHGVNPMRGGRDHTSHRLVFVGVPVPVAVTLIYGAAVSLGWLAAILARVDFASGLLLGTFILAVGVFFALLLSVVPVYENSRQRSAMLRVVRQHEHEPPPEQRQIA